MLREDLPGLPEHPKGLPDTIRKKLPNVLPTSIPKEIGEMKRLLQGLYKFEGNLNGSYVIRKIDLPANYKMIDREILDSEGKEVFFQLQQKNNTKTLKDTEMRLPNITN